MPDGQNTLVIKNNKKITKKHILKEFIQKLNSVYELTSLNLTHPSQIFRANFYLITERKYKISMIIFTTGTIIFQGSLKIKKEKFEKELKQITRLLNEL